jgi:hypothetical protein
VRIALLVALAPPCIAGIWIAIRSHDPRSEIALGVLIIVGARMLRSDVPIFVVIVYLLLAWVVTVIVVRHTLSRIRSKAPST